MKKYIVNIYSGTQGNAGLYIKEITDYLLIDNYNYVNFYYPFQRENINNLFFKYTEKIQDKYNNIELAIAGEIPLGSEKINENYSF